MKKTIAIGITSLALVCATTSRAVILNFEDLTGDGNVPVNYHGLTWTDWSYYSDPQPPYNPSSGVERIYNYDPTTGQRNNNDMIQFGQQVTFQGSWMAGDSYGQYWIGYRNGVAIYQSPPQLTDG